MAWKVCCPVGQSPGGDMAAILAWRSGCAMAAVEKARTKGTLKVQIRVCSDEAAPELDTSS